MLSFVAMMDAAAMDLASRRTAPIEAHFFLQSAIACVNLDLATPLHVSTEPNDAIAVTEEEFSAAVRTLVEAGYPCDVPAEQAWTAFLGWRTQYDATICRILDAIVAPEAPWTRDRTLPKRR